MYNLIKVKKVIKKRKIDIVKYLDKNLDIYLKNLEHNPSIFVDSLIFNSIYNNSSTNKTLKINYTSIILLKSMNIFLCHIIWYLGFIKP